MPEVLLRENMNIMLIRCLLVAKSGTFEKARYEHLTHFPRQYIVNMTGYLKLTPGL